MKKKDGILQRGVKIVGAKEKTIEYQGGLNGLS